LLTLGLSNIGLWLIKHQLPIPIRDPLKVNQNK
jgi:hypothetical protein